MNNRDEFQRAQAKTPQQQFLHTLEQEYHYPPRIAEAILVEAQQYLQGTPGGLQPGQMYVILARQGARNGQAMKDTDMVRVVWTVDDGVGDCQVQREHGSRALRQVRILRLLDEAVDQGAAASQEDLARVLQTSLRTVKRDCAELQTTGYYLPTRGDLEGIGRGQTHKAQIIRLWLEGQTYDQIELRTQHCGASIQRYIKAFVQVVMLQQRGLSESQIALLLQMGKALVEEYLVVYRQKDDPESRQRLEEQLQRLGQGAAAKKGAR